MSEPKEPKAKRPAAASRAAPPQETAADPAAASEPAAVATVASSPLVALPVPLPQPKASAADELIGRYRRGVAAIGESQCAIASGIAALTLELTGFAQRHLTAAGDSAAALIGARTLADAVEIQLGFARRSLDGAVAASTRMGEIGAQLLSDAARPIVAPPAGSPRRD